MDRPEAGRVNPIRPGFVLGTIPVSHAQQGSSETVRPRVTVSALPTSNFVVRGCRPAWSFVFITVDFAGIHIQREDY